MNDIEYRAIQRLVRASLYHHDIYDKPNPFPSDDYISELWDADNARDGIQCVHCKRVIDVEKNPDWKTDPHWHGPMAITEFVPVSEDRSDLQIVGWDECPVALMVARLNRHPNASKNGQPAAAGSRRQT